MTPRVLLTDRVSPRAAAVLNELGVQTEQHDDIDRSALIEVLGAFDGLILRSRTQVDGELLQAAPRLKVIGRAGIGVDNIDLAAATRHDVLVTNTPGGNANAVAEHALGLMLSLLRHLPQAAASMREGRWEKKRWKGRELRGQTLGIIGLGAVGRRLAQVATGVGLHVLASDPFVSAHDAALVGARLVHVDELLAECDILSVHVPLLPATRNLIDASALARLRPGTLVLNLARGGIVDEQALFQALESGHVAGAALDVWAQEPPAEDHPLRSHPRVLATPHIAASTAEAQVAVAVQAAEQVGAFLVRGERTNIVNR